MIFGIWLVGVGSLGAEEALWALRLPPGRHPIQERISAQPLFESQHFRVYIQQGKTTPSEDRLPPGGLPGILAQLELAHARLAQWRHSEPPSEVTILLWENSWPPPAPFSPFDLLGEEKALGYGFHANQRPVVVASFPYSGSQSWQSLANLVESLFLITTLPPTDPFPSDLSRSAARWFAYRLGVAPPRYLWGDHHPHQPGPSSWSPQTSGGWGPLFVEYVAQVLGPEGVVELVSRQGDPTGSLASLLASRKPEKRPEELFASFWSSLWLFPRFPSETGSNPLVFAPRPHLLGWLVASRPASGQATIGVGGGGVLMVEGDGTNSLPLFLQGDPSGRWVGEVVKASPWGLTAPEEVIFDPSGSARLQTPPLRPDERLLVFVGVLPHPAGIPDERLLNLQWGLAWTPRVTPHRTTEYWDTLGGEHLGEAAPPQRARVLKTLRVLAGMQPVQPGVPPLQSRYAWTPQASAVVNAIVAEAQLRGLEASREPFLRSTPWGTAAEWENVVIRLPGSSSRRLPLVLAAHWDTCEQDPWLAFRHGRSVTDNALGVVTLLETAALLRGRSHAIPVEVVLLAGGCHDAAGAQAYLAAPGRHVAIWVELERLWAQNLSNSQKLIVHLGPTTSVSTPKVPALLRRWGFSPELTSDSPPPHTGSALASRGGALTITITGPPPSSLREFGPPEAELANLSADYLLLLAHALADVVQTLGGR